MRVELLATLSPLEPLLPAWDTLAGGVPFRQWQWLGPWWNAYGQGHELCVLACYEGDQLVGLAPWYVEDQGTHGRVLRTLGSGEVCSEYVTIIARPSCEVQVGQAVGDWLLATDAAHHRMAGRWDVVELTNTPVNDLAVNALRSRLADAGYTVHERPGLSCWRLALPSSWDEYTASLSRPNRRRMRDGLKRLEKPDAELRTATPDSFEQAWSVLVDLHQQRWTSQGEKGCFASPAFGKFVRSAAEQFLARGTLRLSWVELAGRPASCSISLLDGGVYYVYQTGMASDLLEENPGWLMQSAAIRAAIDSGCHTYDLLRGNEEYKSRLGAEPLATHDVRIVSRRLAPQLRHRVWLTGHFVKGAIKSSLSAMGLLSATGVC